MTKERPTKDGWYWFRGGPLNGRPLADWMVYVYEERGSFYVRDRGGNPVKVADLDGEWEVPDLTCQHRVEGLISGKNDPQRAFKCLTCMRVRYEETAA